MSKPASCPSATLNLSGFGPTSSYSVSLSASPSFSIVVASAIAVVVVVVVSEDDAFSEFSSTSSFVSPVKRSLSYLRNARRRSPPQNVSSGFRAAGFVLRRGPTTKEVYAVFFFVVFPETTPWYRPGDDDDDAVASVKDIIFLLCLLLLFLLLLLLLLLEKSAGIEYFPTRSKTPVCHV